jgi:hypothetical protein
MQKTIRLLLVMACSFCLQGCSTEKSVEQGNREVALHKSDTLSIQTTLKAEKLDSPIHTDTTSPGTDDTIAIFTDKDVYLLEPTAYQEDEVEKSWENLPWYGLFKLSEREFKLRATRLSIQSMHDDIVDDEGEDTGWQVKVHDKDTLPLLLISGKIALKERKLQGKSSKYSVLLPDSNLVIDAYYQLIAFGNSRFYSQETGENELFNYGLELRGSNMRQK